MMTSSTSVTESKEQWKVREEWEYRAKYPELQDNGPGGYRGVGRSGRESNFQMFVGFW